jgi:hypothetical protein
VSTVAPWLMAVAQEETPWPSSSCSPGMPIGRQVEPVDRMTARAK